MAGMNDMPGDSSAAERFATWVQDHGRSVHGYLRALVRRLDVADDLTQEVFRRAWQARDRYVERGTPRAYLLRIADRLACDWVRRSGTEVNVDAQTWEQVEPAADDRCPDENSQWGEASEQLQVALEELSAAQRRVLLLRFFGELDFTEIAAQLECPLGTVLSHCHRGLKALRSRLAGKYGHE